MERKYNSPDQSCLSVYDLEMAQSVTHYTSHIPYPVSHTPRDRPPSRDLPPQHSCHMTTPSTILPVRPIYLIIDPHVRNGSLWGPKFRVGAKKCRHSTLSRGNRRKHFTPTRGKMSTRLYSLSCTNFVKVFQVESRPWGICTDNKNTLRCR